MVDFFSKFSNQFIKFIKEHEIIPLLILFIFIYNINLRPISPGDTVPASLLPFNILENHNLYLDQFADFYEEPHFFWRIEGHTLSAYPIVTPVLIVPLYLPTYLILKLLNYPIDISNPVFYAAVMIMEKIAASVIASFSGIFIFLSLNELIRKKVAIAGALIFAFATNTWTISSQALWQHGMSELLLSIMIYLVIINEKKEENRYIIYLGILSGLFVFNRPSDSIALLPIILYIVTLKIKKVLYFIGSLFASSLPFIYYNLSFMGNFLGGYSTQISSFILNSEILFNFMGMIISPNRGLLVYSPILILSIFGFLEVSRITNKKLKYFLFSSGLAVIIQIIIYSSFKTWWAGWSYGPRFLTGILPLLVIFSGLYLNTLIDSKKSNKKKVISIIIVLLLIWSVFVQIVGAFYYPAGNWDGDPNIDKNTDRLWDWKDTQIKRSLNVGLPYLILYFDQWSIGENNEITDIRNVLISGWYDVYFWKNEPRRWIENNGTIKKYSVKEKEMEISFNAISFYMPRALQVYVNSELVFQENISSSDITMRVHMKKGENLIRFYTPDGCQRPMDIPELNNTDKSCLSFSFGNIKIK